MRKTNLTATSITEMRYVLITRCFTDVCGYQNNVILLTTISRAYDNDGDDDDSEC
jgi:hypothetical protein